MTIDTEKYQKQLNQKIATFSGKFMNDTKWTKLFNALCGKSDLIKKCLIKDIWDEKLREITIPNHNKYSETFNQKGFKDVMISGPSEFKEIEQLVFLKNWTTERKMGFQNLEPHKFEQDIEKIKIIVDQIEKFETEIDSEKLILYAYR